MNKFPEYKSLNLSAINQEMLQAWDKNRTFEQSLTTRNNRPAFIFYEGPPSANARPGIHHVMARTIKDIFCRYKTLQGFQVERKAGWDTHGLPIELEVEKKLGITKDDIGKSISVSEYNEICRKEVMKFTGDWEELTRQMGYWVDMKDPYITYDNKYIETVWYLLKQMHNKGLLYKGYTIQPYSPAAGTGLSSHELNQPGCYRDVTDITVVAQFKVQRDAKSEFIYQKGDNQYANLDHFILAWTTTPWTLPSNTALAVGKNIKYQKIRTFNPYTTEPIVVILATDLVHNYFDAKNADLPLEYTKGSKQLPYKVLAEFTGSELEYVRYEQLIPWHKPDSGDAFFVTIGDFVSTSDGTGIVHIAPSFGADDFRVARQYGIGSLTLVDKRGRFIDGCGDFSNRPVKNAYDANIPADADSADIDIVVMLKKQNRAFKSEKYVHSYPHCWRTDKPVLYYPLDSWFIRTTALKDRLIALNNTINWKPASTGSGRFGQWLENLVDWNLSRSRYWGIPLPVWATADRSELRCIGSMEELKAEIDKSLKAGLMDSNPLAEFQVGDFSVDNYNRFDLHRPFVDNIVLVSSDGKPMRRETDLIDVWFDSGAMPYAQVHYPFENKDRFDRVFPADFIAEGVDQTRGWFFTLHAIATLLFDSVAFKNVVSNGLVLDKKGQKMSKRLGNSINPFEALPKYGSDAVRWYMTSNSMPWDNLKFDLEGVEETIRKFFGTLYNTYSFFSLYANVDGFSFAEKEVPLQQRPEIDRWIISLLNTLVKDVQDAYDDYEPTKAARAIETFVMEDLSNWYVRLNRKRFWGTEYSDNKIAAYQTLYTCLETVAILSSPIAPFYTDRLFNDLNSVTKRHDVTSVHIAYFPKADTSAIDKALEQRMALAQQISSMVLALRRKVNIKVRQPLAKMLIPVLDNEFRAQVQAIESIVLAEVNVKQIEYLDDASGILVKKIRPNFKTLGARCGKLMKQVAAAISAFSQQQIAQFERDAKYLLTVEDQTFDLALTDVEIVSEDIPGWIVANEGRVTVALDINVNDELRYEGIAREFINRIQRLRKDSGLDVTDKISLRIQRHAEINDALEFHRNYICTQTLATQITLVDTLDANDSGTKFVEIDEIQTYLSLTKVS